jgi:hypothetical protein
MSEFVTNSESTALRPNAGGSLLHWLPILSQQPYWHPSQIKHKPAPDGLKHEQWWPLLKCLRIARRKAVCFDATGVCSHGLVMTDDLLPTLHAFDVRVSTCSRPMSGEARERWQTGRISTMMDEAISVLQLAGRHPNREHCLEMLRCARPPLHSTDQLAANLYRQLKTLPERTHQKVTAESLMKLQAELLERTGLPAPTTDPSALEALSSFAELTHESTSTNGFLHPLLRAVLCEYRVISQSLFGDMSILIGRWLMHWVALRHGYSMLAWIAPTAQLIQSMDDYLAAPERVASDDGDLTYFVLPVMHCLQQALLKAEDSAKAAEAELLEGRHSWNRFGFLNARQEDLVLRAMARPDEAFTIESHREAHALAYATARADLLRMEQIGLMQKRQVGKGFIFEPAPDWQEKLKMLGGAEDY